MYWGSLWGTLIKNSSIRKLRSIAFESRQQNDMMWEPEFLYSNIEIITYLKQCYNNVTIIKHWLMDKMHIFYINMASYQKNNTIAKEDLLQGCENSLISINP